MTSKTRDFGDMVNVIGMLLSRHFVPILIIQRCMLDKSGIMKNDKVDCGPSR